MTCCSDGVWKWAVLGNEEELEIGSARATGGCWSVVLL